MQTSMSLGRYLQENVLVGCNKARQRESPPVRANRLKSRSGGKRVAEGARRASEVVSRVIVSSVRPFRLPGGALL